jgi:ankyrin repeat protein
VRRFRLRQIGGVRRPSPRRRLPCRATPLHWAAANGKTDNIAMLLLRGADGAVQNNFG